MALVGGPGTRYGGAAPDEGRPRRARRLAFRTAWFRCGKMHGDRRVRLHGGPVAVRSRMGPEQNTFGFGLRLRESGGREQ